MGFPALPKKVATDQPVHKPRPTHFPNTPFLKPPPVPTTTSTAPESVENRFSRLTNDSSASRLSTWRKDPFARQGDSQMGASIYDAFTQNTVTRNAAAEPVIEINGDVNRRQASDLLSPVSQERHRIPSRCSSLDNISNPPSIYSPASTMTDLTDIGELNLRLHRAGQDSGYESASSAQHGGRRHRSNVRAQMKNAEVLEEHAEEDMASAHHLNTLRARNKSGNSVASKIKADKVLGMPAPTTSLVSAYVCSGLGTMPESWSLADSEAIRGIQPSEHAMGTFWRPEVLHNAFSGDRLVDLFTTGQNAQGRTIILDALRASSVADGRIVPDAGPDAAKAIAAKCVKAAHPKDVEVINSPTCPPNTCHTFTFTLPRHDTLAAIARTRLNAQLPPGAKAADIAYQAGFVDSQIGLDARGYHGSARPEQTYAKANKPQEVKDATEIRYYGVTVLTWYHADERRHEMLKVLLKRYSPDGPLARPASMRSVKSADLPFALLVQGSVDKPKRRRLKMPWASSRTPSEAGQFDTVSEADTHFTEREPDRHGPLYKLGIRTQSSPPKIKQFAQLQQEEYSPRVSDTGNVFWIPVAHTLVSRHPIYDTMLDFLRLDTNQFARDAYWHNFNILRLLNTATPRPGELYRLRVGTSPENDIALEAYMPGAVDFEKGIVKVDYQLWPFFQAVDLDHILVCIDVAMSQTGRVILTSKYTHMLSVAVNTLKYILDLRGWEGIAIPIVHARDTPLIVEDPGPYIIGLPSEFRSLVTVPSEVVFVDLDTSSLVCKSMPVTVSPKPRRDKAKARLTAVFGPQYTQVDRSVPIDFKVASPMGCFQHLNRLTFPPGRKPKYVGQPMSPPSWWHQTGIMTAFDKIMADKHKKPSLLQRLTRTGVNRVEAQLSVGEQLAKVMMRRRALHYVESRDQLEIKIAKVNARLASIAVSGRFWRGEFVKFESYATQLAVHTERLRVQIEREKQDTKRFSNLAAEQSKVRTDLEVKLQATEDARAEAMRQLSDMHHSIQELEREREQIMDVFEDQLNMALDTIPETVPQSPTLSDSIRSLPRSPGLIKAAPSRSRPTTRDSDKTTLSRLTTVKPVSLISATRSTAPPAHGGGGSILSGEGTDSRAFERSDYVSERIAAIQAKLELALQASTARTVSAAPPLETVKDDDENAAPTHADRPPRSPLRQIRAASAMPQAARWPNGHSPVDGPFVHPQAPPHGADRRRPASVQVRGSTYAAIGDTTFGEGDDGAGAMAKLLGQTGSKTPDKPTRAVSHPATPSSADDPLTRRNSLMKPGVGYRIRPKRYSMTSTSGRQSAASIRTDPHTDNFVAPALSMHDKIPTGSTEDGELRTPQPSVVSEAEQLDPESVVHVSANVEDGLLTTKDFMKDDDARRLSAISTATVTFGQ